MNPQHAHRTYCVMDIPLALINQCLQAIQQNRRPQNYFFAQFTPYALHCLYYLSQLSVKEQQRVLEGEEPLYKVAEQLSNKARHFRQELITGQSGKIEADSEG